MLFDRRRVIVLAISTLLGCVLSIFTGVLIWLRFGRANVSRNFATQSEKQPFQYHGLSETEAATRLIPFDEDAFQQKERRRFLKQAIQQNLLTIFNIDLFAIGILMFLLDSFWGWVGALVVLLLNLFLNVSQEMYTRWKLDQVAQTVRPSLTVIRDRQLKSIDPTTVVTGDLVIVAQGDEVWVDGQIVSDGQVTVEEKGQLINKNAGDVIKAGSFCVNGRILYEVTTIEQPVIATSPLNHIDLLSDTHTPLQKMIEKLLQALFFVVLLLTLIVLIDSYILGLNLLTDYYRDGIGLIFGIAPTSLFFILIVHYAVGSLRIANRGALVYRAQAIESLANVSVLCVSKQSVLSDIQLSIEPITTKEGDEPYAEHLIRQILGDMMQSHSVQMATEKMLAEALPGKKRLAVDIAPVLNIAGWYGITFQETDLQGTFIVGRPDVLRANLKKPERNKSAHLEASWMEAQTAVTQLGRNLFRRNRKSVTKSDELNWRTRLGTRLQRIIEPLDTAVVPTTIEEDEHAETFLFAYLPEPQPLHDRFGRIQLPANLQPLAYIHTSETIRPEAIQTMQAFTEAGVKVKLFSSENEHRVAEIAKALSIYGDYTAVSGSTLENISNEEVMQTAVFGQMLPPQKAQLVARLQEQGEFVAVIGNNVTDIPAMRQADLRIALQNSSQAALMTAEMVLLKDAFSAMPSLLKSGQRIVNGVLDTFKLYLSQVTSQLFLLLIFFWLGALLFPYHPTQGSVISVFTITIPNMLLVFWASTGRIDPQMMRHRLAHFVLPMAFLLTVLVCAVYLYFRHIYDDTYAQYAVTFALLCAGWIRILFVQPPTWFWVGGDEYVGDKRVSWLTIGSVLIFVLVFAFPLFQELLRFSWLRVWQDYVFVFIAVAVWLLLLRTVWRSRWLNGRVHFMIKK